MSDIWDEIDLDIDFDGPREQFELEDLEEAPAPVAKKQTPAPVPQAPKKAAAPPMMQDPKAPMMGPQGKPPAGGPPNGKPAPQTQNPQVPNLPKLPKMPAGMELPEFKGSKHNTDDVLDKYFDLLNRADTQEDEVSLNAILSIAEKYLAAAEFLGQKEIEIEQAKFQAQFDLILNAQKIAQQDAENKQKLKQNDDYHKQKLKHGDEANKIRIQAQKDSIAQRKTDQAAAKKASATTKKATPK